MRAGSLTSPSRLFLSPEEAMPLNTESPSTGGSSPGHSSPSDGLHLPCDDPPDSPDGELSPEMLEAFIQNTPQNVKSGERVEIMLGFDESIDNRGESVRRLASDLVHWQSWVSSVATLYPPHMMPAQGHGIACRL